MDRNKKWSEFLYGTKSENIQKPPQRTDIPYQAITLYI